MLRTATVPMLASLVLLATPVALEAQELRAPRSVPVDSAFHGIAARAIGPSGTSGRVSSVTGVTSDPRVLWVGAATGGLWKSGDGGFTWTPMMDTVAVGSIGVVSVNQAAPDIVWVGTGEGSARNSMGVGRGVWRSLDGGRSWKHLGLERTERIERIILHPMDPDVAWVSALGPAWSDGTERGVFKTTDGGRTWRKVLYVNERTGAFDMLADPANPQHLIVSTWEYRRWPWFFRSGGAGSGLWQSWDGGETWARFTEKDGMPAGELGRIGLAWAQNDPKVVYALVEAAKPALLRSDNGGVSWRAVNTSNDIVDRPFYYNRLAVDPTNENRVYRILSDLSMSEDGGRTFRSIAPWASVHVDHHSMWTHPDGRTLVTGNDGGVFVTHDRGSAWRFVENLVLAQFYHIAVDSATPFNVYGGLQDNGTWMGPSEVWEVPSFKGSAIVAEKWHEIGFGDGFAAIPDPTEPGTGYSMSQGGFLRRFDIRTNEERTVRPPAPDSSTRLRFNWNAGIALDPFDARVVYYGSQFVHRSPDRGETWTIISPDLTSNDPEKQKQHESGGLTLDVTAAENHTTILTIAPSTLERGVIWVGTDDGQVQVTRDGGNTWTNATGRITGMPAGAWVPHIEASKHDAGTAYVVVGDHQRGDWTPRIYRTTDYGRTWRALNASQLDGHVHVVEEDPVERNLLFAGTEFGLFVSLDAGASWKRWTHGGFPAGVPVRALVVHPRDHDLVVGTHGRGAWILDDIRPVREMARDRSIAQRPLHLFPMPPAVQAARGMRGPFYFPGDTKYHGPNRPAGALISFWVAANSDTTKRDSVQVEILEGERVIRTFRAPAKAGMNRTNWGLERAGLRASTDAPTAAEPAGPQVVPGRYTVRITLGANTSSGELIVRQDPRTTRSLAVQRERLAIQLAGDSLSLRLREAIARLDRSVAALELTERELKRPDALAPELRDSLVAHAGRVKVRATALLDHLRLPPSTRGIVDNQTVTAAFGQALGLASGADGPSAGQRQELEWASAKARAAVSEVDAFFAADVTRLEEALRSAGFRLLGGR